VRWRPSLRITASSLRVGRRVLREVRDGAGTARQHSFRTFAAAESTIATAVVPDLPAYCRWRPSEVLGDLPNRSREISSRSSSLSAAKALPRDAGAIPPWSTTIRSTPVLFFLSSAGEMAAALCPFFHRSHSSAFCAAVNQIRDVTMKHLLTS
jgi:hypothetical protein